MKYDATSCWYCDDYYGMEAVPLVGTPLLAMPPAHDPWAASAADDEGDAGDEVDASAHDEGDAHPLEAEAESMGADVHDLGVAS